jgi:tetratricopeptide (TPR) repeat protein
MSGQKVRWLAVAAIWAAATCVYAQVRGEVTIRSPGNFRSVGTGGAVGSFQGYSYGLGALQTPSAAYINPLRSSIESRASYAAGRPDYQVTPSTLAPLDLTPGGGRLYNPIGGSPTLLRGRGASAYDEDLSSGSRMLRATSSYLNSLGGSPETGIAGRLTPITSLVGGSGDQFSTYMSEGEKAFLAGNFDMAMERFKMANTINPKNPESLLSMAHASFAMSRNSYYRAAYYLGQALKFLPELPLAPLQPKAFFAQPKDYAERIDWLNKHLQTHPFDNDAFFVAAYFRWFDQDVEGARLALLKARSGKVAPDLQEAVDTFWAGMKASGKIGGMLESPTTVAGPSGVPSSQPTSAPAPVAERAVSTP